MEEEEMRRMVEQVKLPLDGLQKELDKLEHGSLREMSDDQLWTKVSYLHAGYHKIVWPIEPGTTIYRAVNIEYLKQRPKHQSEISYPPQEIASKIGVGRMNRAQEIVFYGSLAGYSGCLEECSAAAGQLFALSCWTTKERLWVNHFGYTKEVIEAVTKRQRPATTIDEELEERDAILRSWQSRIVTRIGKGSEDAYKLTIIMKEIAWKPSVRELPNGLNHISGTMYPSLATSLRTDNIVVRTSEVDSRLDLCEVLLLVIHSRKERFALDEAKRVELEPKYYDFARPDEHGNLIWGQQSQVVSAYLDMTKVQPRRLKPDIPYSHVGWSNFR